MVKGYKKLIYRRNKSGKQLKKYLFLLLIKEKEY